MALTVKISDSEETGEGTQEEVPRPSVKIQLNLRKTIDGNLLIFDHHDVDIAVMPKKRKIVAFPKDRKTDDIYHVQDRFFKFLADKGIISLDAISGGSIYGSLEAVYPESEEEGINPLDVVLYAISKFIEKESEHLRLDKQFDDEFEKDLTEPDEDDSTELGEVPHAGQKGSIRPGYIYSPYGISSVYRYE
jgi:hypothetical protein